MLLTEQIGATYFEIMYIVELLQVKSHVNCVYDKFDNTTFSNILELGQRRITGHPGTRHTDGTAAKQEFAISDIKLNDLKTFGAFFTIWLICRET